MKRRYNYRRGAIAMLCGAVLMFGAGLYFAYAGIVAMMVECFSLALLDMALAIRWRRKLPNNP